MRLNKINYVIVYSGKKGLSKKRLLIVFSILEIIVP